ncbi:hypothetical protein sscle_09g071350 [Sclerotinia sclerotiorum 1980 UF-70]|uniref:Uncharacterized protein n=2 Tax=Sclerotinia sclerotiorum (strain ATCC 18683 / 1980 / Ss-1) TaxID=665079 RepID=A0A1D9QBN9_SCLS1|nr:hypothetical protein sscle_09g071350 [Sclerotinia sclerotiorum 1980 UF-70]
MPHVPQRLHRLHDKVTCKSGVHKRIQYLLSKFKTRKLFSRERDQDQDQAQAQSQGQGQAQDEAQDEAQISRQCSGFFNLPAELRHEIYSYLFRHLRCRDDIFSEAECHNFFTHEGAVLFNVNRWFLNDAAEFLCRTNPRFMLYRPSLCLFAFSITHNCVRFLKSLEISAPSSDTALLEPVFEEILASNAPLTSLTLHLIPTFPGSLSYPWPMYIIPRLQVETPAKEHFYNVHPHYLSIDYHSQAALDNYHRSQLLIGKLENLQYLKITGQPEFDTMFELAIVKLHLGMMAAAKSAGSFVALSPNNGPRGEEWYYEIWIAPTLRHSKPASSASNKFLEC